jgi:hypothetical protein
LWALVYGGVICYDGRAPSLNACGTVGDQDEQFFASFAVLCERFNNSDASLARFVVFPCRQRRKTANHRPLDTEYVVIFRLTAPTATSLSPSHRVIDDANRRRVAVRHHRHVMTSLSGIDAISFLLVLLVVATRRACDSTDDIRLAGKSGYTLGSVHTSADHSAPFVIAALVSPSLRRSAKVVERRLHSASVAAAPAAVSLNSQSKLLCSLGNTFNSGGEWPKDEPTGTVAAESDVILGGRHPDARTTAFGGFASDHTRGADVGTS